MRHRSTSRSPKSTSSGHIVVFDEQCCVADEPPKNKKHSPLRRLAGTVARLVVLGFCLNGVFLLHDGWRRKLTSAVRNLALQENISEKSVLWEAKSSNGEENGSLSEDNNSNTKETTVSREDKSIENGKTTLRLPNVLVVGAQLSGTTSVASWLFHHDNVCKPASVPSGKPIKEAHFFDSKNYENDSPEYYGKHFVHCGDKTHVVDATPDYLQFAERVYEMYEKLGDEQASNLKVVMVVREPVDREFSWYTEMVTDSKRPKPPKYTRSVLNKKGEVVSFEKYTERRVLPKLTSSHAGYDKWLREWINTFSRKQLLVLSYDELAADPESAGQRLQSFLNLQVESKAPSDLLQVEQEGDHPTCPAQSRLASAFEKSNNDLYKLLDDHQGPDAEQRPFPEFKLGPCKPVKEEKNDQASTSKTKMVKKKENSVAKAAVKKTKKHRAPPATVFFATHHKTGTDISRAVASLLKDQGIASYTGEYLDEKDLMKDGGGEDMKCSGSVTFPEIRSYNQWPKWIIDNLWGKCVGKWWESWPGVDTTTKNLFEDCIMGEMDSLKAKLKEASCGQDYLVVHFVRNPIDLMLSSYRYTKLGKEEWMHENIVGHPRFKGEYCGDHDCLDMTIQEAVRDLPVNVGLLLEMRLVSMEIVKQMMVGSVLAKGDPTHHITVSLSEIMESSESFEKTWTKILGGVFPTRSTGTIRDLVKQLKKFDMNADPENFAGRSHSTVGNTSKAEADEHKKNLLSDKEVEFMMNDPLIKTLM